MIDYGQVKFLTLQERLNCAKLIVNLANNHEVREGERRRERGEGRGREREKRGKGEERSEGRGREQRETNNHLLF